MRTAFLQTIVDLMRKHEDIITITADMGFSVFEDLQKEFTKRFFNTGATEQSTIGIATGFALSGYKVYFYAQAPFATMRCFEQIRLDVAYNHVDVKIVGAASGFNSNQLGVSHFALEDVALMRLLPGMTIFTPGDPVEAKWATVQAYTLQGPAYIRLTKSGSPLVHTKKRKFKIGEGIILKEGKDMSIFVSGSLLPMAEKVHALLYERHINATLISMPTIKPLDKDLIRSEAKKTHKLFTLEEHSAIGGLGSAVAEVLAEENIHTAFHRFGVPDRFTNITGTYDYLLNYNTLSEKTIVENIEKILKLL